MQKFFPGDLIIYNVLKLLKGTISKRRCLALVVDFSQRAHENLIRTPKRSRAYFRTHFLLAHRIQILKLGL